MRTLDYERLYDFRFRDVDQRAREEVWREIALHIYGELGRPEKVLDPAAGRREFISAIPARERWAVDRVAYPEATGIQGVKVITADIMDVDLPSDYFDAVFVSNFLEHLPDAESVALFLSKMYASVRRGGRIAVLGPNFRYCAREYFDCADHTLIFTHVSVAEHLYAAGFSVVKTTARFLPYSFRGRLPASAPLTRLYLKAPIVWRVVGKQFLVVGEK